MKKNNYTKPSLEVINLSEDVILTSGQFGGNNAWQDDVTENNFWGAN